MGLTASSIMCRYSLATLLETPAGEVQKKKNICSYRSIALVSVHIKHKKVTLAMIWYACW